jgi:hypothetical protein
MVNNLKLRCQGLGLRVGALHWIGHGLEFIGYRVLGFSCVELRAEGLGYEYEV